MSDTNNLWAVVVGGLIGIAGGTAGPLCLQYFNRKAERISLGGALVSEISGLVHIAERRKYIEGLGQLIAFAERNPGPPHIPATFYFSVRRNPFMVYDANLARIGLLHDPLPRKIVRFYTMASAVLEDIADMKEATIPRTRDDSIKSLKSLHQLFGETMELGKEIISASNL